MKFFLRFGCSLMSESLKNEEVKEYTMEVAQKRLNVHFLLLCTVTTDLFSTVCQSEELGKYFADLGRMKAAGVRPNSNCSAGNWTQACDAGWAAVGLSNGTIPANTTIGGQSNSRPCCAGFFCPPGLTCMIRKFQTAFFAVMRPLSLAQPPVTFVHPDFEIRAPRAICNPPICLPLLLLILFFVCLFKTTRVQGDAAL